MTNSQFTKHEFHKKKSFTVWFVLCTFFQIMRKEFLFRYKNISIFNSCQVHVLDVMLTQMSRSNFQYALTSLRSVKTKV